MVRVSEQCLPITVSRLKELFLGREKDSQGAVGVRISGVGPQNLPIKQLRLSEIALLMIA